MATPVPRSQRLFSLLLALHLCEHGPSRAQLREGVLGYEQLSDADFDRQFSRDKAHLRQVGIEVLTRVDNNGDQRYFVSPPNPVSRRVWEDLSDCELALLPLARGLWDDEPEDFSAKLSALFDLEVGRSKRPVWVRDSGLGNARALAAVAGAIEAKLQITFNYPSADDDGRTLQRRVEPWKILLEDGRSLIYGWDVDRQAARHFALTRISGSIRITNRSAERSPDLSQIHTNYVAPVFWYRRGVATDLERYSEVSSTDEVRPGWELRVGHGRPFRAWWFDLLSFATQCCVVEPVWLREEIIDALRHLCDLSSSSEVGGVVGKADDA